LKRVTPEKVNVYKGFRAFEKSRSEKCLHAPKRRALPTAPHPESDLIIIPVKWGKVKRVWSFFEKRGEDHGRGAKGCRGGDSPFVRLGERGAL
jgi:hypothetical protein